MPYSVIGRYLIIHLGRHGSQSRFFSIWEAKDKYYLERVDKLLYEKLKDPIAGEGQHVLDSLYLYCQALNETILVYQNNGTGQDIVDALIDQKGPKCMLPHFDDEQLKDKYQWTVKELGELYHMLCNVKMLWRDFRYYLITKLGYDVAPMPTYIPPGFVIPTTSKSF